MLFYVVMCSDWKEMSPDAVGSLSKEKKTKTNINCITICILLY